MIMFRSVVALLALGMTSGQAPTCDVADAVPSLPFRVLEDTQVVSPTAQAGADVCGILPASNVQGHWFSYTAQADGCLDAEVIGLSASDAMTPPLDPILLVYTGTCSALMCTAMADDISLQNLNSLVELQATAGTTYYFLVTGFGGESAGPFSFTIVPSASTQCENPSANQICPVCPNGGEPAAGALFDEDVLCSDAAVDGSILDDGGESCAILQIAGTTICGCPTSQESCPLCPGGEDVANPDLVVLGDGSLTCGVLNSLDGADTCGAVTAGFAAECGCPGTTPCRLCDETATNPNPERLLFNFPPDNAPYTCADAEADIRASAVLNPIEQGCSPSLVDFVTGFDVVDFCCFNGDFPGDLNISNCDSASVITALPFTVSGNTGDATPEVNAQAESCGLLNYGEHQGEWYTYTADANGCVTVRTSGNLDSMLFVYSGECSDLTCVAMNDDAVFTVSGSELTFDAVAGTRYFFMVTGSSSDDVDTYTLEISQIAGNCPSPTGGELCPVCPDGSDPDPTAFYNDDLLCIDAAAEFGVVDGDSQDCVLFQTIGAPICGCEVVAADTCNLCPDGEDVPAVAAGKSIPDALTTCSQLNNVAGTSTCGDVTAGVANFCECPSSSPICTLCDASSTMFNPDLVLLEDGNYTCGNANEDTQYYYLWYPLDAEGCNPSIAVSFIDSGINVIDYCCNGGPLTGTLGPTASPATGPTASSDVPTTDSGAGAGSGNTPESTSTSVAVSFRGGIATVSLLCLFVLLN